MRPLAEQLHAWQDADLLTTEQVASILAFEEVLAAPTRRQRRTVVAEAVGYLGAAFALGALGLLLQDVWWRLTIGGRLALVGLLTVLLFAAAVALSGQDDAPLQRLTTVLFTGGWAGGLWLAGLVGAEVVEAAPESVALAVGLVAVAVALPLYLWRRRALHQLSLLAGGLVLLGAGFAHLELPPAPLWIGVVVAAIGVAWVLLGAGGWLPPGEVAETTGAIVAVLALQLASFEEPERVAALVLLALVAAASVALAVGSDRLHLLVVGAVALFVALPQLVFELFGDAIGAPATLLVVGLTLVLLAVGLGRARAELAAPAARARTSHPDGPAPDQGGGATP